MPCYDAWLREAMSDRARHSFPGAHALQLVQLLRRWSIPAEELLAGFDLTEASLAKPDTRISVETLRELTRRARTLTGEPGLGFYLGLQKRLTMYGYLGFGAMTASTMREALELLVRYVPTVTTTLGFRLEVEGDTATLAIDEHVDLGDVHDVAVFSLVVGMRQLSATMTGHDSGWSQTDLPIPEPGYYRRFAHLLPEARFGQPKIRVSFDAADLELPLMTPDPAALRLASEACERQLAALGFDDRLQARIMQVLTTDDGFRSIEQVARELAVSTRTLKRRLADQGLTFSEIVTRERYARALALLARPDLTLEDIGNRLGYSDAAGFARAFRRWTGETPAQYRKRLR